MILSPARVEQTLNQFEAQVIPEDHPALPKIKSLWGDHTYFLAANGLNIVEPVDSGDVNVKAGTVINLASWTDGTATSLAPQEPQATEVVVEFDPDEDAGEEPDRMH